MRAGHRNTEGPERRGRRKGCAKKRAKKLILIHGEIKLAAAALSMLNIAVVTTHRGHPKKRWLTAAAKKAARAF
jgi:hypothetical protein